MRIRRTILTLAALAALLCGPAAARADVLDSIKWKTDTLTVKRAGGDDTAPTANTVLLVSNGKNSVVVKFSYDVPLSINFADRALREYGVPTPESVALPVTDPRAAEAKAVLLKKLSDVGITDDKFVNDCTTLSVFEVVKGADGQKPVTVASVFNAFYSNPMNPQDPVGAVKKVQFKSLTKDQLGLLNGRLEVVRLLRRNMLESDQAKLLGRLYVLDALLGNEDRLQRGGSFGLGWQNLMLGTVGENKIPGFVAIDNRAFAPSLRELAWLDNLPAVKDAFKKSKPGAECEADLSKPDFINRGRADWVERLIRPRKDKKLEITDELGMKTGDVSMGFDLDGASKAVVNDLRKQMHVLLFKDMRDGWQNAEKLVEPVTLAKTAPADIPTFQKFDDANVKDFLKKATAPPRESDDQWAFALAYSFEDTAKGPTYAARVLDWGKVRENIRSGMEKALLDLASAFPDHTTVDDQTLAKFKTSALAKWRLEAAKLAPDYADAVAEEAVFVRQAYLSLRWFSKNRKDSSKDKEYLNQITAAFKKEPDKATGKLEFVLTMKSQQMRRK